MTADTPHIGVVVSLPVEKIYTYHIPQPFLPFTAIGKRVVVPFGNRMATGYIWALNQQVDTGAAADIKSVIDILDEVPLFPAVLIPLFEWIAAYYMYPLGQVVKTALPGGINPVDVSFVQITESGRRYLETDGLPSIERDILSQISSKALTVKKISHLLNRTISNTVIYAMRQKGLIVRQSTMVRGRTREKMEKFVRRTSPFLSLDGLPENKQEAIRAVGEATEMRLADIRKVYPAFSRWMKTLEKDGYIVIEEKQVYRDPLGEPIVADTPPVLLDDQRRAVQEIQAMFDQGFTNYLLYGVTGSGKTEVYMHVCEQAISKGKSALVLVPEIALISQTEKRFRARFGDQIAVLHSGLSPGERYDQWLRIARGETPIVIGARSAIFAPLQNPGIIIVDEEHDASYKQDSHLRYNARDIAVVRAKQANCVVILGSATPSIQSYYNTTIGKSGILSLETRINQRSLPDVEIVDLRTYRDAHSAERMITPPLRQAILETLARGEQVVLFLNRRGFANFPLCDQCGESLRCKNCDITLTLHKKANAYKCHFCGFSMASVSGCTICGSTNIKILGLGTEKVEQTIVKMFPQAQVARLDQDTTKHKGDLVKVLKSVKDKKTDILIGTQMVAKGHDFPGITLVGIICADLSLNFPDFRSGVRTFQLIAQVAGRAGRGHKQGRVILQTYAPEHFSIDAARSQDFFKFYDQEILFRKSLAYPPFSRLIQLRIAAKDRKAGKDYTDTLGQDMRQLQQRTPEYRERIAILGPIEAPMHKIANQYRWQILVKCAHIRTLHQFVHELTGNGRHTKSLQGIRLAIDVDPFSMM